jgi:DNA-nicking Smr family endonuclease
MEPIEQPIDGVLDLHTFNPKELSDLLDDYFEACLDKGITSIRIIHGKGRGVLKTRVRSLLSKNAMVRSYKDAPEQAGGWGATLVELHPRR